MNLRQLRAVWLAFRLLDATGSPTATLATRSEGGYLIQASLPEHLDGEAQLVVLDVLQDADRCGHRYRPQNQSVWLEVH